MAGLLSPALPPARDAVAATLRRWAAQPFVWGETDCFQSVLTYAEGVTGRVLEERPAYDGPFSAARVLLEWGGFEPYCACVMGALGCPTTLNPERGDIGLVNLPVTDERGFGLTLCLCTGDFWAARGESMVVFSRAEPVAAWRVIAGGAPCLKS